MNYPRIITEISNHQWAITEQALENILKIVEGSRSEVAREIFHSATEEYRASLFDSIDSKDSDNDYTSIVGDTGIISIDGPIVPRSSSLRKVSGMVSISSLTKEFKRLEADDSIKEIVLLLDSPGGAVTGVSEFSKLVAGSKKRTTSYVYGMAASAAYWIASSADSIVSSDTGQVGSIGVVATLRKSGKDDKIEIVSSRAKNKRPDPETEAGRAEYQKVVDDLEKVFIDTIAKNRSVSIETVESDFGKGGILIAENAFSAGMIDGVSTLDELLTKLKTKAETGLAFEMQRDAVAKHDTAVEKTAKPQEKKMTIEELLRADSEFAVEYNAKISAAFEQGKTQGADDVRTKIKLAVSVLDSDYPPLIKKLALDVVAGKDDPLALRGAVTVYDSTKGAENTAAAIADSDDIGNTPAQTVDGLSSDGVVRTEEDFHACVASLTERR
jgi:ClpP class serine protease